MMETEAIYKTRLGGQIVKNNNGVKIFTKGREDGQGQIFFKVDYLSNKKFKYHKDGFYSYEDEGAIEGIHYNLRILIVDFEDFIYLTRSKGAYSFTGNKGQFKFSIKDTFAINRQSKKTFCKYHRLWDKEYYQIEITISAPKDKFPKPAKKVKARHHKGYAPGMSKASTYKSGGYMEVKHPYSGGSFSPK